jgi:hypothetical protein
MEMEMEMEMEPIGNRHLTWRHLAQVRRHHHRIFPTTHYLELPPQSQHVDSNQREDASRPTASATRYPVTSST